MKSRKVVIGLMLGLPLVFILKPMYSMLNDKFLKYKSQPRAAEHLQLSLDTSVVTIQTGASTHPTVTGEYEESRETKQSKPPSCISSEAPLNKRVHGRPNIVYMLADDLGYGDVQYNGGKARTPNLNAMADGPHSIHFSRFYSGGPTCSPTRGTLLTGRNHNRYCI